MMCFNYNLHNPYVHNVLCQIIFNYLCIDYDAIRP